MYKMEEHVNIKDYSTLRVGGQFRYFSVISSADDLASVCAVAQTDAKYKDIPIFILGGGSNVVFSDGIVNVIALKIEIKGFETINDTNEYIDIKVGAGEIWDEIVEKTVGMNLSGLESLSAIPGTVGASPVQNVGAYGSEVKDNILEVGVYDTKKNKIVNLSNEDCKFGYRDSIFKNEEKGRYVITAVTYKLKKTNEALPEILFARSSDEGGRGVRPSQKEFRATLSPALEYPGVLKYFKEKKIENPSLKQIREAIIEIRKEKLPNPKEIPNVGSFFKNPIVENVVANKIKKEYPDAKFFPVDDVHTKVPAGWLIENAGLKGKSFGKVSVYDKNALILINNGDATKEDFINTRNEIIKIVKDKFGINLEQEPEII